MPSLTRVSLPKAFINRHDLKYKSSNCVLLCFVDIGELIQHERLYPSNPEATVHSSIEWNNCSGTVDSIIVDNNACNDTDFVLLDLTRFASLRVFEVGCYSFSYVKEVKLIGLSQLERVEIGAGSFSKGTDGVFEVAECEALETISIDDGCFPQCSVVLFRGECWFNASSIDLPSLKKLTLGKDVFCGDEIGETRLVMKSGFLLLC